MNYRFVLIVSSFCMYNLSLQYLYNSAVTTMDGICYCNVSRLVARMIGPLPCYSFVLPVLICTPVMAHRCVV